MFVRMYACMYVCVHARVYVVCGYVFIYRHYMVFVCNTYIRYVYVHRYVYVYIHILIFFVRICIYIYVPMHYIYIYIYHNHIQLKCFSTTHTGLMENIMQPDRKWLSIYVNVM